MAEGAYYQINEDAVRWMTHEHADLIGNDGTVIHEVVILPKALVERVEGALWEAAKQTSSSDANDKIVEAYHALTAAMEKNDD